MGARKLYLAVAALLGAAVALLPGLASGDPPSTASFTAVDYAWDATGGGNTVTIAQGGTVSFSYPTGSSMHNAEFTGGSQPTSCTQTAGTNSGGVPPLPNQPTAPGWTGSCTFNTPGTYTFQCHLHPFMTGTIVVQSAGTTTTATTPTTPSSPTTPTSPSTPTTTSGSPTNTTPSSHGSSPLAGTAASAISIAAVQRGVAVRGGVKISTAGVGGRLEVDVFAAAKALRGKGRGFVRVDRVVLASLRSGTARFSATLDALARRALRRHRLALTVVVTVRAPTGTQASGKRTVLLRA